MKMMMVAFNTITKMAEGLIAVQDTLLVLYSSEDNQEKERILQEHANRIKKSKQLLEQSRKEQTKQSNPLKKSKNESDILKHKSQVESNKSGNGIESEIESDHELTKDDIEQKDISEYKTLTEINDEETNI